MRRSIASAQRIKKWRRRRASDERPSRRVSARRGSCEFAKPISVTITRVDEAAITTKTRRCDASGAEKNPDVRRREGRAGGRRACSRKIIEDAGERIVMCPGRNQQPKDRPDCPTNEGVAVSLRLRSVSFPMAPHYRKFEASAQVGRATCGLAGLKGPPTKGKSFSSNRCDPGDGGPMRSDEGRGARREANDYSH